MANPLDEYGLVEEVNPNVLDGYGLDIPPPYIRRPTETYGEKEKIYVEAQGKTIDAPAGSAKFFDEVLQDDTFDAPSTVGEEFEASIEKQGAYFALLANAYGLVGDSEAAGFVADRSKALKSAQQRAPEYMKRFNRQWDNAKGFFEGTGVVLDNPRAIGRTTISQLPNAILPLVTSYAGLKAGSAGGAAIGSVVPAAGTAAGAVVGGVVGSGVGAFTGSTMMEVGSQLDELLLDAGYDTSDANSVLAALQNDSLMQDITKKAERKGITTATVDAFFTMFGGKFLRMMSKSGKVGKAVGGVADISVQSGGETLSEAAGQYAREGKIDWKDAALEGITSMGKSVGDTAIGYSARTGRDVINKASDKLSGVVNADPAAIEADSPDVEQAAYDEYISNKYSDVEDAGEYAAAAKVDIKQASPERVQGFKAALGEIKALVPEALERIKAENGEGFIPVPKKRYETLSDFLIRNGGVKPETGELKKYLRKETPALNGVVKKTGDLTFSEAFELARKEGFLKDYSDETGESLVTEKDFLDALDSEAEGFPVVRDVDLPAVMERDAVIEYNDQLDRMYAEQYGEKPLLTTVKQAFKKGVSLAVKDVKAAQTAVIDFLDSAPLEAGDKAKFIRSIKNITSAEKAQKAFPEIEARVTELINSNTRREAVDRIKKTVRTVKKSKVIAVDFAQKILDMVDEIDLSNRQYKTVKDLEETLNFMDENPDVKMPKDVLKQLEILNKKPLDRVSTQDLVKVNDALYSLVKQGKVKLRLLKEQEERLKKQRISELQAASVPLWSKPLKEAPIGERLSAMESIKNRFIAADNKVSRLGIVKNGMDVIFDILDGNADYNGQNHRIFKQSVDKAHSKYLDLKETATREIKELSDKLGFDERNFERIGVHAAAQQEGGIGKLEAAGISQDEIDAISLTPEEIQMYDLMRKKLDEMFPRIKETMRKVYNKDVQQVDAYFPFMTDYEAMRDFEIQNKFGEDVPQLGRQKNVKKGFTEERTLGKQAIRVDALNVFLKHMDDASYLVEMGGDLKALGEIAASKEYGSAVGDIGQEIVVDWITLLARKGGDPTRIRSIDVFRSNIGFAVLGFKLTSALIQPTALIDGAALIGPVNMALGLKDVATSQEWRTFLKDNMPEIRERVGDDPAYMDMGGDGVIGNVREAGMWAIKRLDMLAAASVAAGAYRKAIEEKGGTVDLTNPDPEALQDAQLMMRRTQSSVFLKDASPLMSQGEFTGNVSIDKLIFQFQSFMLNRWSIISHDMWDLGIGKKRTAKAMNIAAMLLLANAAEYGIRTGIKAAVKAGTGDDDKEKDDLTEKAVYQLLGNIPFVSQVVSSFRYGSMPVPAIGYITNVGRELQAAGNSKSEEKKAKHYASAAILTAGVLGGIPGTLQAEDILSKATKDKKKKGSTP